MNKPVSRRTFIGTAAGAGALALAGCSGSSSEGSSGSAAASSSSSDESLIVYHSGDPVSFCPDEQSDDYLWPIACNIYNRLFKITADYEVIPDVCESYDVSDDGLTFTFHLRDDLVWSDGEPLTAEDARYTFDTIHNNESYFFYSYLASVDTIEAPDDTTLVFNMLEPDASLITNLGWYACFIMPEHIYNQEGVDWLDNEAAQLDSPDKVVTSSAYRIGDYTQGQNVTLVANEESPLQPYFGTLVFSIITDETTAVQALINNEIDVNSGVSTDSVEDLEDNEDITLTITEATSSLCMVFNCTEGHVPDSAVRNAIAMCVDRDAISNKVYAGYYPPEQCILPHNIEWASNTEDVAPDYDLEAAEQCLIDAGYEKDSDGYYITGLTIDVFDSSGCPDVAKLIVAEMDSIGIECEVNVLEYNAWAEKVSVERDFDIEIQGGALGPDPSILAMRYSTTGSSNLSGWSNEEFDELCAEGNQVFDEESRGEIYKQAQAVMAEELPMVPITSVVSLYAYNNRIKNLPNEATTDDGTEIGYNDLFYAEEA